MRALLVLACAAALRSGGPPTAPRVALIDNYDSFTYNLYHLLARAHPTGAAPRVLPNDACGGDWDAVLAAHSPTCRTMTAARRLRATSRRTT